jgi:hypothetical protein
MKPEGVPGANRITLTVSPEFRGWKTPGHIPPLNFDWFWDAVIPALTENLTFQEIERCPAALPPMPDGNKGSRADYRTRSGSNLVIIEFSHPSRSDSKGIKPMQAMDICNGMQYLRRKPLAFSTEQQYVLDPAHFVGARQNEHMPVISERLALLVFPVDHWRYRRAILF